MVIVASERYVNCDDRRHIHLNQRQRRGDLRRDSIVGVFVSDSSRSCRMLRTCCCELTNESRYAR